MSTPTTEPKVMKAYLVDIGLCVRVIAESPEAAQSIACEKICMLPESELRDYVNENNIISTNEDLECPAATEEVTAGLYDKVMDFLNMAPATPGPAPDAVTHYIENHLAGEVASIMDEKAQELTLKISDNGKSERSISWKSELKSEDAPGLMTTTTIPATPGNTSMQKCTESFHNSHWLMTEPDGYIIGIIKSKDPRPIEEHLKCALIDRYDDAHDIVIHDITEVRDQKHEVTITRTGTFFEDDPTIVVTLTPVWEY